MYFEAKSNGIEYELNVTENSKSWKLSIKKKDGTWKQYTISKKDYQYMDNTISFIYDNSSYLIDVVREETECTVYTRGVFRTVEIYNDETLLQESLKKGGTLERGNNLNAGMPGKIVEVVAKEGKEYAEGDPLIIMEAMKMENELRAPRDIKVKSIHVKKNDNVEGGSLLISFEP